MAWPVSRGLVNIKSGTAVVILHCCKSNLMSAGDSCHDVRSVCQIILGPEFEIGGCLVLRPKFEIPGMSDYDTLEITWTFFLVSWKFSLTRKLWLLISLCLFHMFQVDFPMAQPPLDYPISLGVEPLPDCIGIQ